MSFGAKIRGTDRVVAVGGILCAVLVLVALFSARLPSLVWLAPTTVGTVLTGYGLIQLRRARSVMFWVPVSATVLQVSVGECFTAGESGGYFEYFPLVRFSYLTSSGAHESDRFSLAKEDYRDYSKAAIETLLQTYPVGSKVTAYVSPRNQALAVLQRAVSRKRQSHYLAVAIGGFLVIGVALVVPLVLQS